MSGYVLGRILKAASLLAALSIAGPCGSARADEYPAPLSILKESRNDLIVDGLGKLPAGEIPVAVYKVADFAREVGEAAVDREDETRDGEVILMRSEAASLKALVEQGKGNDPDAQAIKGKLRQQSDELNSHDAGNVDYLLNITAKHFDYAVSKASLKFALSRALSRFLEQDSVVRFVDHYVHFGSETASIIGNRSALRPLLANIGWRKFGTRAAIVQRSIDKFTDAVIAHIVAGDGAQYVAGVAAGVAVHLYDEVMAQHPSKTIDYVVFRQTIASSAPAPAAAAIAPPIAAAIPVPMAAAAPAAAVADPVARSISNEDRFVQRVEYSVRQSNTTYQAAQQEPPTNAVPEQPSASDVARERELHEELMCVGSRNAGCERWNLRSTASSEGTWDGSANQTSLSDR